MGKRGPQPKPTALKKFEGNPGKRPMPEGEPKPPQGDVVQPFELDEIGQQVWSIMLENAPPDMVTPFDSLSLWQFCDAWSDFFAAHELIQQNGRISISEKGGEYQNPAVGMKNKAAERIKQLGALFGWSPSSRVGLALKESDASPGAQLLELLKGGSSGSN